MSFESPRRIAGRSAARVAAAALVVVSIAGCAAGQDAQTAQEFSGVDGVNSTIGSIGLRNVGVSSPTTVAGYAAKGTATLSMSIINNGANADQLEAVSSPAASSVQLHAGGGAAASTSTPITIPSRELVQVGAGAGGATISLQGLTAPLISGQDIDVTFTFRDAGTAKVRMAVKLSTNYSGGETVDVAPTGD